MAVTIDLGQLSGLLSFLLLLVGLEVTVMIDPYIRQ